MRIFHDPNCLLHDTVELLGSRLQRALECPERLESILQALEDSQHTVELFPRPEAGLSALSPLLDKTHDAGYIEYLRTAHARWVREGLIDKDDSVLPECFPLPATSIGDKVHRPPRDVFAQPGFYSFDMSTGLTKNSWASIQASANLAACAAKDVVLYNAGRHEESKHHLSVLALCRPPGHHCTTAKAGGYCYINNAVVAVEALRHEHAARNWSAPKVAVLDLDVHHGNGTQDAFYEDASVLYVSIHARDEYPYYSGFEDERGRGAGVGLNVNLPLEAGSSLEAYLEKLGEATGRIEEFGPAYMVVSLGLDTFMLDPLGKFQIDTGDYVAVAARVRGCERLKRVPTAILLVS